MKLIKKYLEFIKENINEHFDISKLEDKSLWNLNVSEIRDCFIEFEDARYDIDIELIFMANDEKTIKLKEGMKPGYYIKISQDSDTNINIDLTDDIKGIYSYITSEGNANIRIYDGRWFNHIASNINNITIKDGIYIKNKTNSYEKSYDSIILMGSQKESKLNITQMDLLKYYKWDKDEIIIENNKLYIELNIDVLVDIIVNYNQTDYIKILKDRDNLWDMFNIVDFYDHYSNNYDIISNNLDLNNSELLMKCLAKEYGGTDKILDSISEYNDEDYNFLKDKSEEDILEYISRDGAGDLFEFLFIDSEVISQIIDIIANYSMNAYADEYYNRLIKDFDASIGEYLEFTKSQKDISTYEHDNISTFYKIEFDNYCLDEIKNNNLDDYLDNDSNSLVDLMCDWISSILSDTKLDPYFPDYANIDSKEFNLNLKKALESYISDPNVTEIVI
jgi:hypothetical protein